MIFHHLITLYPVTVGQSEIGGISQTIGQGTTYQAFVQTRTDSIDVINNAATGRTAATIYVLGDCPAKTLDRIGFEGRTYEVFGAMPQRIPGSIHHTKIMAIELNQTDL